MMAQVNMILKNGSLDHQKYPTVMNGLRTGTPTHDHTGTILTYDSSEGSQAIANFYWDETIAQPWAHEHHWYT